jgi:hypothetical protein
VGFKIQSCKTSAANHLTDFESLIYNVLEAAEKPDPLKWESHLGQLIIFKFGADIPLDRIASLWQRIRP